MNFDKIYIMGDGLLGGCLKKYLVSVGKSPIMITRNHIDFEKIDIDGFGEYCIGRFNKNDIVINCVGILKPNVKLVGEDVCVKINKNVPRALNIASNYIGFRCINFSSDCVFSGRKGPYSELDFCDASDIYALTKDHECLEHTTVIRTSFIGHEEKHKIGLLEFALKNKNSTVNGYSNCYWNGLTSLELSKFINSMIDENYFWRGVRHVYSENGLSKYELLRNINDIYDLGMNIVKSKCSDISGTKVYDVLDRRLRSIYDGPNVIKKSIYDQISELKEFYT